MSTNKMFGVFLSVIFISIFTAGMASADLVYTKNDFTTYIGAPYSGTNTLYTLDFTFNGSPNTNVYVVGESVVNSQRIVNVAGYNSNAGAEFDFKVYGNGEPIANVDRLYVILDGGDGELFSVGEDGQLNYNIGDNIVYRENIVSISGLPQGDISPLGYYPGRSPYRFDSVVMDTSYYCFIDTDCSDNLFCNGAEVCSAGSCIPGVAPCSNGEICNESNDTCSVEPECYFNSDCSDNLFCNGAEVCSAGSCIPGVAPCGDGETCEELTDRCVGEPDCYFDSDCDDNLFCNGEEECVSGQCVFGVKPCEDDEVCHESTDQCVFELCPKWDLDGDCDVDKYDANILKSRQKSERDALKYAQKAEMDALKYAQKAEKLAMKPVLTKAQYKLLLDEQKAEMNALKYEQKNDKATLLNKQRADSAELKASYTY